MLLNHEYFKNSNDYHMLIYGIIIVIGCVIFIMHCINEDYLKTMHRKIFPVNLHRLKLNDDITKEKHYKAIVNSLPKQIDLETLKFLLKHKNFMELPNVYSLATENETTQMQELLENVIRNNVNGCLIETGVWRGGMCMWMQCILKRHKCEKNIYLFDVFGTFPDPVHNTDIEAHNITKIFYENQPNVCDVIKNFNKFNLFDTNLKFIVGEFKNTVPKTKIDSISILRCDSDYYDSTMLILDNYYFKISKGGYVIIDDYNNKYIACKNAVDEFRNKHGITNKIVDTHSGSVYWQI